jgi:small neutral amino acid transporter SnatA (MarC family)
VIGGRWLLGLLDVGVAAGLITRLLGRNGLRATSKVVSLLLAAIAVRLVREGLATFLQMPSS